MSTISNERLEEIAEEDNGSDVLFESSVLARELLALRKERERAEPVAYIIQDADARDRGRPGFLSYDASSISDEDINEYEISSTPLYTTPPAPVVPDLSLLDSLAGEFLNNAMNNKGKVKETYTWCAHRMAETVRDCRAAMLQSGNDEIGSWKNHKTTPADKPKSEMAQMAERLVRDTTALAVTLSAETDTTSQQFESLAGKAAVPAGWKLVPMRLTAENGAKGALSGEFSETKFVNCHECFGDDECETCDGSGRIEITLPVTWTTIKEIWTKGVEHFAAFPQSPGNDPSTVSGKWIPCSERMPEVGDIVLTADNGCVNVGEMERSGASCRYFTSVVSGRELPATHWQPLPEPPCK